MKDQIQHALVFLVLGALALYSPYRTFGVVPFTTTAQMVDNCATATADQYADVGAMPQLSGDAQKDFMWCRFCHSFEAGGPHGVGPNLHRVFGRCAGSAKGFYYSAAVVTAGKSGLTWDDTKVAALISDPAGFLDGQHRMRYKPITDPAERQQIIAALKVATK